MCSHVAFWKLLWVKGLLSWDWVRSLPLPLELHSDGKLRGLQLFLSYSWISTDEISGLTRTNPFLIYNLSEYGGTFKDWSTLFLFALGNERTLVTCKSCEARSASQRLTCDQCPFVSQCNKTKRCTSILIFMLKRQITPKSRKNQCQIFGHLTGVFHWKIFATVSYASSQSNDIGV